MKKGQTVFVGLSGGVDSSVAALRLKNQGYNVVGVFIKVWHPDFMACNWEQERLDAMRVAAHLQIPFLTCDAEATYRDEVAVYFISEYQEGRTPNPDVMCNKAVKFGAFMKFAKSRGADYIATGHYAQKLIKGKSELHRGLDEGKDQTYFLWTLSQEQLDYALFPVGDTPKMQIRKEAAQAGIPVATKNDSQGICFLGHVDVPDFLSHYIKLEKGDVFDEAGARIGTHKGAFVYTLGQRHGFEMSQLETNKVPHYVVAKNTNANTITVSKKIPVTTSSETIKLHSVVLRDDISENLTYDAQFRYQQNPFKVNLRRNTEKTLGVMPSIQVYKPAAGQSCVLYKGSKCIGGGMIA